MEAVPLERDRRVGGLVHGHGRLGDRNAPVNVDGLRRKGESYQKFHCGVVQLSDDVSSSFEF